MIFDVKFRPLIIYLIYGLEKEVNKISKLLI